MKSKASLQPELTLRDVDCCNLCYTITVILKTGAVKDEYTL